MPRSSAGQRLATCAFRKVWLRTIEWLRFWPPTRSKTRLTFTKPRTPLTGGCVSTAIISLKRRASWSCWMCGARSANKQKKNESVHEKKNKKLFVQAYKNKKGCIAWHAFFMLFKKFQPSKRVIGLRLSRSIEPQPVSFCVTQIKRQPNLLRYR